MSRKVRRKLGQRGGPTRDQLIEIKQPYLFSTGLGYVRGGSRVFKYTFRMLCPSLLGVGRNMCYGVLGLSRLIDLHFTTVGSTLVQPSRVQR